MKITDPQVIKNGEKDLIASVQEDLDPETIKEILKERMAVATMAHTGGQIVVHKNEIAFRLDFEVNLNGSLLFDRDGNLIEEQPAGSPSETPDAEPEPDMDLDDGIEGLEDIAPDQNLAADPVDDIDTDPIDDLSIDLPEYDLEDDLDDELDDNLVELIDENGLEDPGLNHENHPPKDLDDDINDILKESREFWEQKEDS